MTDTTTLTALRPLVFSIAYRMLGEVAEAEDIAQETLLRAHRELADGTAIEHPKAYMTAIATRLAIDHLRSGARASGGLRRPVAARAAADRRRGGPGRRRRRRRRGPSWPTTSRSRS
jgi:DNA-directed RNA polymerase specialized sigma24 family protein